MLYTGAGDNGTSTLFRGKDRLPKDHKVYDALGSVDELNSLLGLVRAHVRQHPEIADTLSEALLLVQEQLFIIQAEIAGADKTLTDEAVSKAEHCISRLEAYLEPPKSFVVPGATEASAWLDYSRAVSRRVERTVVALPEAYACSKASCTYLNRLSSLLYALARWSAQSAEAAEQAPQY